MCFLLPVFFVAVAAVRRADITCEVLVCVYFFGSSFFSYGVACCSNNAVVAVAVVAVAVAVTVVTIVIVELAVVVAYGRQ